MRQIVEQGAQKTIDLLHEFNAISDKLAEPMDDQQMNRLLEKPGSPLQRIGGRESVVDCFQSIQHCGRQGPIGVRKLSVMVEHPPHLVPERRPIVLVPDLRLRRLKRHQRGRRVWRQIPKTVEQKRPPRWA